MSEAYIDSVFFCGFTISCSQSLKLLVHNSSLKMMSYLMTVVRLKEFSKELKFIWSVSRDLSCYFSMPLSGCQERLCVSEKLLGANKQSFGTKLTSSDNGYKFLKESIFIPSSPEINQKNFCVFNENSFRFMLTAAKFGCLLFPTVQHLQKPSRERQ